MLGDEHPDSQVSTLMCVYSWPPVSGKGADTQVTEPHNWEHLHSIVLSPDLEHLVGQKKRREKKREKSYWIFTNKIDFWPFNLWSRLKAKLLETKEKGLCACRGRGGGRGGKRGRKRGEDQEAQAGRWLGSSLPLQCLATTPRKPSQISHKSFLSSVLEQFIRLREPSTTGEASYQVVPNNSIGHGVFVGGVFFF